MKKQKIVKANKIKRPPIETRNFDGSKKKKDQTANFAEIKIGEEYLEKEIVNTENYPVKFAGEKLSYSALVKTYFAEVSEDLWQKYAGLLSNAQFQCKTTAEIQLARYRIWATKKAEKEITFFPKSNFALSFKPFFAYQGLAVFVLLLISFIAINSIFFPTRIDEAKVIKTAQTKKLTPIVAEAKPIQWSVIVKRSEITNNNYLLKLPKSAANIKITPITKQEAMTVLSAKPQVVQLTNDDRRQLAKLSEPDGSFLASLVNSIKYLLADLEGSASDAVETIAEQINPPEGQPEVIQTQDATVIDLSAEVSAAAETSAEDKQAEKENKKEDKQQEKEDKETQKVEENQQKQSAPNDQQTPPAESVPAVEPVPPETPPVEIPAPETPVPSSDIIPSLTGNLENTNVNQNLDSPVQGNDNAVETTPAQEPYVQVTYETPAPTITEQETENGKLVTVSAPDEIASTSTAVGSRNDGSLRGSGATEAIYTDVLAFTTIPEIYKVGQEDKIKIRWTNNNGQEMDFTAFDLNNNGKLDYVEWTVPHLSDQIFEIIFISKAFELDENKEKINDIYDIVYAKDNNWATVPSGHYVRATFEKILDSTKDVTIYAKPTGEIASPSARNDGVGDSSLRGGQQSDEAISVEVWATAPSSAGSNDIYEEQLVATFPAITSEGTYKVLLTDLITPTDVFDLKIVSGGLTPASLDIDWIVDPSVGDSFSGETKIGRGSTTAMATTNVVINSGITIAPCYTPNPSWTLVGTSPSTVVRDLFYTANSTTYINKDIYCDSVNCILWTAGATAPGTVCIATDTNVYPQTDLGYGLLWSKTDIAATKAWANTANSTIAITGGDIGGTHTTNKAGSGSTTITNYKWLERYYTSANGTAPYYPAMDACKLKGLGWRLPTILELDSIRDQTASSGIYSRLPGIVANGYWSSSERSATNPFYLYFVDGYVYASTAKTGAGSVRCVRGY